METHPIMRFTFCLILFLIGNSSIFSQTQVLCLDTLGGRINPDPYLLYFEDTTGTYSFEEVQKRQDQFIPFSDSIKTDRPKSHLWVKLSIENSLAVPNKWIMRDWAQSGYFDGHFSKVNGSFEQFKTGAYFPKQDRDLKKYHYIALPIALQPYEQRILYFHIQNIDYDTPSVSLELMHKSNWDRLNDESALVIIGGFVSMLIIMFLYSLMIFIGNRESTYLFYALYIFSIGSFFMFARGPHYLQFAPIAGMYIMMGSLSGISIFYFLFGRKFLNNATLLPKWDKWIKGYIWLRVLIFCIQMGIMAWDFNIEVVVSIEFTFFLIDAIISLIWFIPLIRSGSKLARFFIAGSSLVFVLALGYIAISILWFEGDTEFMWFALAVVIEILIFSLGLGYRIRQTEIEKREAQAQQLKAQEALNEELSKINSAFGRFVPHEFLRSLGHNSILDVKLGDGVEKEVTVLFSDIRGYTTLSERMSPKENFVFLNAYLGRMGPIIQQNRGFVNQYYGDGIMALFMESPEDALKASIEMFKELEAYNESRAKKDRAPIRIGVGLHTGSLMMGVMGDTLRLEAGVVSDTVNTTARMEGLTKYYQSNIILSEYLVNQLPSSHQYDLRFLAKVKVKGREESMKIYECYESNSPHIREQKRHTQAAFDQALEHYFQKDFVRAAHSLDEVLSQFPDDPVAAKYKELCTQYLMEGVDESWTGIELMSGK